MNLQDRIEEILIGVLENYRKGNAKVPEATKAILALVEEEKYPMKYQDHLGGETDVNGQLLSGGQITAPPTVSEQCCWKCVSDNPNHYKVCLNPRCDCHSPSSGVEPTAPKADWYVCSQCGEGFATHHSYPKRCHHLGRIATKQGSVCRECGEIIPDSTAPVGGSWESEFDKVIDKAFDDHGEQYEIYAPTKFGSDLKDFIRQTIKNREREIAEGVEAKYGAFGKMSGSFGYQGQLMDIQAFQTEGDQVRDFVLALINKQLRV